jgi:hypothetical protein
MQGKLANVLLDNGAIGSLDMLKANQERERTGKVGIEAEIKF